MIAIVSNEKDKRKMLELCEKTPYGCKISAIATAYGFDRNFSNFWIDQTSGAVFCLVDDVFVISGTVGDVEETNAFMHALGVKSVICAVRNAELLELRAASSGEVMMRKAEGVLEPVAASQNVSIRDIYNLLDTVGMVDEFEAFYLDLSHKIRHDAAFALTHYEGGGLAGCVVASSITDGAAILSAVVVQEAYRRRGIASRLMKKAEALLAGRTIYIFKEKNQNDPFYKAMQYKKIDTWVTAEIG